MSREQESPAPVQECRRSGQHRREEKKETDQQQQLEKQEQEREQERGGKPEQSGDEKASTSMPVGKVIKLDAESKGVPEDVLREATDILQRGGVIAVPTDTIYGIACLAQSTAGVKRLYEIKGRDERKPVAICVHDVNVITRHARVTVDRRVLRELLPGPVTVVLPRKPELNPDLNPHTAWVGVRVPDFTFLQHVVERVGQPIALTSANRSGEPSCITCSEFQHLWPELNAVYDAGEIKASNASRLGSTVVKLMQGGKYHVIRPGSAEQHTLATLHHFGLRDANGSSAAAGQEEDKGGQSDEPLTKKSKSSPHSLTAGGGAGGGAATTTSATTAASDAATTATATTCAPSSRGAHAAKKAINASP